MSWFRKKKQDDDPDAMLQQIVRGSEPIRSQLIQAGSMSGSMPAPVPSPMPAPMSMGAPGAPLPAGVAGLGDMSAIIARSLQAITDHGDMLRARGIDPNQIQQLLQSRLASGGAGGPIVITAGGAGGAFATTATSSTSAAGDVDVDGAHGALVGELEDLARLHASGALSDDEFAVAKSRLLGGS